jgi:hypothetical protein
MAVPLTMLAAKPRTRDGAFYGTGGITIHAKALHVIVVDTADGTSYPMEFKVKKGAAWSDTFLRRPREDIDIIAVHCFVNGKLDQTLKFEKPGFHLPAGHVFKVWFHPAVKSAMLMHSDGDMAKYRTYALMPGSHITEAFQVVETQHHIRRRHQPLCEGCKDEVV